MCSRSRLRTYRNEDIRISGGGQSVGSRRAEAATTAGAVGHHHAVSGLPGKGAEDRSADSSSAGGAFAEYDEEEVGALGDAN